MLIAQEYVGGSKALTLRDDGSTAGPALSGGRKASWRAALRAAFLPQGYPGSVSPDYLSAWALPGLLFLSQSLCSICRAGPGRRSALGQYRPSAALPTAGCRRFHGCRLPGLGHCPSAEFLHPRHAVEPGHSGWRGRGAGGESGRGRGVGRGLAKQLCTVKALRGRRQAWAVGCMQLLSACDGRCKILIPGGAQAACPHLVDLPRTVPTVADKYAPWPARSHTPSCAQAATPLGAVFQFFMRDLTGMAGGILFATAQVRGVGRHLSLMGRKSSCNRRLHAGAPSCCA